MATFSRSPKTTLAILATVILEHFPELKELQDKKRLKIACLDVHADLDGNGEPVGPALKHGGYAVMADISATPKKWRALGMEDVVIRLDADRWDKKTEDEQAALLDHELYHLIPRRDAEGAFKFDDLGRPQFAMRLHDVEVGWFVEVAQRRGFASVEVQQAKDISDRWGQFLFQFATTENLPGLKTVEPRGVEMAAAGEWKLWDMLSLDEKEQAEEKFSGDLNQTHQFYVDLNGDVLRQEPIGESPANEQAEAPKSGRGRKAAGGKSGAEEKPKRSHKKK